MFIRLAQYINNGNIMVDVLDTDDFALDTITKAEYDSFKASMRGKAKFKEKTISGSYCIHYWNNESCCVICSKLHPDSPIRVFTLITKSGYMATMGRYQVAGNTFCKLLTPEELDTLLKNPPSGAIKAVGITLTDNYFRVYDIIGKFYEAGGTYRILRSISRKDLKK